MRLPLLAALAAAFLLPAPAWGQQGCMDSRMQAAMRLADKYGERPVMRGLRQDGTMLEIYVNPETGAWTAVVSEPNGRACQVDEGKAFRNLVYPYVGPKA